MGYRELIRRKFLEDVYNKMSDEEKLTFVRLTMQDKNCNEILQAIRQQNASIEDVSRKIGKYPFASDLLANVAGNAITDGIAWLGSKLFKLK